MERTKNRATSNPPVAVGVTWISYILGTIIAPIVYPYKMYSSDTFGDIVNIQIKSLIHKDTYIGVYILQSYLGLIIIFILVYFALKLNRIWELTAYFFALGIYYGIMIKGALAAHLHTLFDNAVRPKAPELTQLPLYLIMPIIIMLGLPLFAAYTFAKARKFGRKETTENKRR